MTKSPWTETQLEQLNRMVKDKIPVSQIAQALGRSPASIRGKLLNSGVRLSPASGAKLVSSVPPSSDYSEDRERTNSALWKSRYKELESKYKKALSEASVTDQLVAEVSSLAPRSYAASVPVITTRARGKSTVQSAVLMFSDTHVGKVVSPQQTLGFGEYNFSVFLARLKYLEESVISILDNHTTMKVDELVIAMLGDMLDGALLHGVEAGQRNTLFSQFYGAGHAIAQFLRSIAAHVPKIRIETVVGNHPRWQNQKRMPTENRFSNLDMFLYALLEALTKDIPNIHWNLGTQPFSIFTVGGWTFHAAHGDHLRGGDKALGIPNHAIGREISTKTQIFSKNNQQAPHYYLCGHLHRSIQLPHALGDVLINGGFPGLDNYSLAENFNPVDASQRLFFVHPRYAKTAEYALSLKFASPSKNPPYVIPGAFPIE